jgi:hypothetical protein
LCLTSTDTFDIYWFEGHSKNGHGFRYSNWEPYFPEFEISTAHLEPSNTFHRIQMLLADSVATGIVQYNDLPFNQKKEFYQNLEQLNCTFFFQAYEKDKNGLSYPLANFPEYLTPFLRNQKFNWYAIDDFHEKTWKPETSSQYSEVLRKANPTKKLLACPSISTIIHNQNFIFQNYDMIAPQNYPLIGFFDEYKNLDKEIPRFNNFKTFHKNAVSAKKKIHEQNIRLENPIKYGITLQAFHENRPIERNRKIGIWRFPDYEEFRFMFYDAIICGAEFLCIYNSFQMSKECYENVKKVIHEFRYSKLDKAIVQGVEIFDFFEPVANIETKIVLYKGTYYCLIAHLSDKKATSTLKLNSKYQKELSSMKYDSKLKRVKSNVVLKLQPYDIKIIEFTTK